MRGRTNVAGKPEEERTVTVGTSKVTIEPTKGKTMKKVTVNPTPSQTKTVTAGTGNVDVSPDSGKLLSGVTVKPTPTQEKTVTPTTSQQTGVPDSGKHLSKVTVEAKPSIKVDGTEVDKGMDLKSNIAYIPISALPYKLNRSHVVVFRGEIHILGGDAGQKNHYKHNGSEWVSVSTLPFSFYEGNAVVFDDKIHIFGSMSGSSYYKVHYAWDGSSWTKLSNAPYSMTDFNRSVALDNKIICFPENFAYKFESETWTLMETYPYNDNRYNPANVGGTIYYSKSDGIYTWSEATLAETKVTGFSSDYGNGTCLIVEKNGAPYIVKTNSKHFDPIYRLEGATYVQVAKNVVYMLQSAINFDDRLTLVGSSETPFSQKLDHWEIADVYEEA